MATLNFDATGVSIKSVFDPLPAGEYACIITDSELKHTKDGSGQYLEVKLEVQSGEFTGRTLFDRLNLINSNKTAVEIAQRQLAQVCNAVGILQVADSQQLHYKPLIAVVKVRPASGNYDAANDIKGYKPAVAGASMASPFAPPQAKPAAFAPQPFAPQAPAPAPAFGAGGMPWAAQAA